ncbi:transcriptional regulator ATRX isoform X2 [Mugil cephalus]|uniref:transcriptional regulator ATRX isoform X2 n=1 Tax=Mugil cephalus TaxID=48193 RepID=UPI001FB66C45|nr:transcriptional regulator ATRX isoform X2 [Mugil cephalus]
METKYPVLRRPKRKLCYVTSKENPIKQWEGTLTLDDVDKMFDDLESSSYGELLPTSLLPTSDTEANQNETEVSHVPQKGEGAMENLPGTQMGPEGDVLHPSARSPSPKLEDLDISFKVDGPVQTSSPIELHTDVEGLQKQEQEKYSAVSSVLTSKSPCKEQLKEKSDESESESTPIKVASTKKTRPEGKAEASDKKEHVAEDKNDKKPQSPASEDKRKMPSRTEDTESLTPESELEAPEKNSCSVRKQPSPPGAKDVTLFLQKLKDTIHSKLAYSRNTLAKVPPPLPEPEDDFLILEDDEPFVISIPNKNVTSKRRGQSRTSSTDKDSSADTGSRKKQEKTVEVTEAGNDQDKLPSPQEPSADDLLEQKKPNKKKQKLKKVPSKESNTAEDELIDKANGETGKETHSKKMESKKSSKDGKENIKSSRANSTKGNRKRLQRPEAVKDTVQVDVREQSQEDHKENTYTDDLGPLTDKEMIIKPDAGGKSKRKNQPAAPERISDDGCSSDAPQVGKRRRKSTGQWWLSFPQSSNESNNLHLTPKKSKQNNEEADVTSPVKAKKANVLKESQKRRPHTGKGKKTKQDKKRNARGNAADEIFNTAEAEHNDKELDQDQEQSSPLLFSHRDHGLNSDKEIIKPDAGGKSKRKKQPAAPERISDDGCSSDAPQVGKRRRKPTGQWWLSFPQSSNESNNLQLTPKKSKQNNEEADVASPAKAKKANVLKESQKRRPHTGKGKKTKQNKKRNARGDAADEIFNTAEAEHKDKELDQDQEQSSPLLFSHRDHGLNSGGQIFHKVYHHTPNEKISVTPAAAISPRRPTERLGEARPVKCETKPRGDGWMVDSASEDVETVSSQSQQPPPKEAKRPKERKKLSKRSKSSKSGTVAASSKPPGGAPVTSQKAKPHSSPADKRQKKSLHSPEEATDCVSPTDPDVLCMDVGVSMSSFNKTHDGVCQRENTFKTPRSGPTSLIDLHDYEESDITGYDIILPRIHDVLSGSDLCALPLRPLVLQPKDKANLTEWFKSLWSTTAGSDCNITPDHFDWYFYQDRAMGLQVDLKTGSICNGKILLGSFMKKPLWVDHSATTVFNLITSSLRVIIDGTESRFNPGQSFMVECGHAYSIQNLNAQPAVVYFTRMSAEGSS